jgi:hypothetical protein
VYKVGVKNKNAMTEYRNFIYSFDEGIALVNS